MAWPWSLFWPRLSPESLVLAIHAPVKWNRGSSLSSRQPLALNSIPTAPSAHPLLHLPSSQPNHPVGFRQDWVTALTTPSGYLPRCCIFFASLLIRSLDHELSSTLRYLSCCAWCLVPCLAYHRHEIDICGTNKWSVGDRGQIQTGLNLVRWHSVSSMLVFPTNFILCVGRNPLILSEFLFPVEGCLFFFFFTVFTQNKVIARAVLEAVENKASLLS